MSRNNNISEPISKRGTGLDIRIVVVDNRNLKLLGDVIRLHDQNVATLGFFTPEAFKDHAFKKWILAAVDEDDKLAGYILYRIVQRSHKATIVHFCVAPQYRGKGISDLMFEALKHRTRAFHGISLSTKIDPEYEFARRTWKRLGFSPIRERKGRAKAGSTLKVWWYDHGHRTLFDVKSDNRIRVAIDANVFFDFHEKYGNPESRSLLEDWLQDEVEFVITDELIHEIDRNEVTHLRQEHRQRANMFQRTRANQIEFRQICEDLQSQHSILAREENESDLRQIAWAICDKDTAFFVTRDEELLEISPHISEVFQLTIIRPSDLWLQLDELFRVEEYRRMRFGGTLYRQRRVQKGEDEVLSGYFQNTEHERKTEFLERLRRYLLDKQAECHLISDKEDNPLALVTYNWADPGELSVPMLRVVHNVEFRLVQYILLRTLALSAEKQRNFTAITDGALSSSVLEALRGDTFNHTSKGWVRPNLPVCLEARRLADYLEQALESYIDLAQYYATHLSILREGGENLGNEAASQIERVLWPAKLADASIPTLSIPIQAVWAYSWFDYKLAEGTLFGASEERAFNREGVYYSAKKLNSAVVPGRVLWYVSKGKGRVGRGEIRACSRLDDIVIGTPKELFRKFKHLGVYEWKNVLARANGSLDKELTAFRFSDTQLFVNPVSYEQWSEVRIELGESKPAIYGPNQVSNEEFVALYRLGMGQDR